LSTRPRLSAVESTPSQAVIRLIAGSNLVDYMTSRDRSWPISPQHECHLLSYWFGQHDVAARRYNAVAPVPNARRRGCAESLGPASLSTRSLAHRRPRRSNSSTRESADLKTLIFHVGNYPDNIRYSARSWPPTPMDFGASFRGLEVVTFSRA
jgi:hypothetical protein